MIQQRPQAEPAQPPIRELHAVDVLELRHYRVWPHERHQAFENVAALILRHESQAERRHDYIHVIDAALVKLLFDLPNVFVYEDHSRVAEIFFEIIEKARIDFENNQGSFLRQFIKQGARHHARACAQFNCNPRFGKRQRFHHGSRQKRRARRNCCRCVKVRQHFGRKNLQAHDVHLEGHLHAIPLTYVVR